MQSFLSLLGMGKAGERAQSPVEEAAALLASCPTQGGPDLDKWVAAVAPHFMALVQTPKKEKEKKSSDASPVGGTHGLDLVSLPRVAVARLLANDQLCVESEYQAYLFATAHAELHAFHRYQSAQAGGGSGSGSGVTDLRGSDALYGQFSAGALKLLSGQRTDTSSQHSEAETHNDEEDGSDEDEDEGTHGGHDEQQEEDGSGTDTSSSSSVASPRRATKSLNLRGTAGLYQHMSQGALKSRAEVKAEAAAAPEGDESDALVAEWLAKEQQDKLATTEQPAAEKEAEKKESEAKGKEKDESEAKEAKEAEVQADEKDKNAAAAEEKPARKRGLTATGRKGQTAQTGGKAARRQERRRARQKQVARKRGAKGGNESDDSEDFYDDPELRQFRQTDTWRAYMREAMADLEPHIRFPLISPHWLTIVETHKLVSRNLITEAYRHQTLMQMGDTSLYTPPKNNSRMQPRSYVNAIQWDTDRHGLHIKISNNGKVAKKLQSHWYSVALGKDGYEFGRHYWAIKVGGDETYIGIATAQINQLDNYLAVDATSMCYNQYGSISGTCATTVAYYLPPYKRGDVIGVLLDMDKKELSFFKNGASLGQAFRSIPAVKWYPAVGWRAGTQTLVSTGRSV